MEPMVDAKKIAPQYFWALPSVAKKNEKIVRPSVRSVVRSSVRSFVRPFVRSFVRSSVRECARIAKTRKKRRKRRKKRKNRSASKMKDRVVTIHFVQFSSKSELSSGGKRPFKVFSFSHFFWPQAVPAPVLLFISQ